MGPIVSMRRASGALAAVAAVALFAAVPSPALALGDSVKQVSAGGYHTCALRTDGTVWCWGDDSFGQLGDGTTGNATTHLRLSPVQVERGSGFLSGITAISAGDSHTCARRDDGTAWCWGRNQFGQLGDGTTERRSKAVRVQRGNGSLAGVTAISAGLWHSCARTSDGKGWCWGRNQYGQLGDGTTGGSTHRRLKAVQVLRGGGDSLAGVTTVDAGDGHSCARKNDGTAWCWGWDLYGQLGDGSRGNANHVRLTAVKVQWEGGVLTTVQTVSAGTWHGCARRSDGSSWCWGSATYGELGDGTTGDPTTHLRLKAVQVQQQLGALLAATTVSAGGWHSCTTSNDERAWCWGDDFWGEVGNGAAGDIHVKAEQVQTQGGPLTNVAAASAGTYHSCAVTTGRTVWCWGDARSGQLGNGVADAFKHPYAEKVTFP